MPSHMEKVPLLSSDSDVAVEGRNGESSFPPLRLYQRYFPDGLLPRGSVHGSAFSMATVTLGAGTIAIPGAFMHAGALLGTGLLLMCASSTVYSIRLLVTAVELTGYRSYEQLARGLFGPWFERVTALMIIGLCWGVTILYTVAMGDILENLRDSFGDFPVVFNGDWGRRLMVAIYWACTMLPLSLVKSISTIRYATFAGITATFVLVLSLAAYSGQHGGSARNVTLLKLDTAMMLSAPVFIFSCCCQTNAFGIYSELKNKSIRRMTLSASMAMAMVASVYIIGGIAGSSVFGDKTKYNILMNFDDPFCEWYVTMSFFAICITLTMAFPMCIFPTRDAVVQVLGYESTAATPRYVFMPIAGCLAAASVTVGFFVPGIAILFAILGGICGSALCFIWPALYILKTGQWTAEKVGLPNVIATYVLLIGGGLFGLFGTAISIYKQFRDENE